MTILTPSNEIALTQAIDFTRASLNSLRMLRQSPLSDGDLDDLAGVEHKLQATLTHLLNAEDARRRMDTPPTLPPPFAQSRASMLAMKTLAEADPVLSPMSAQEITTLSSAMRDGTQFPVPG